MNLLFSTIFTKPDLCRVWGNNSQSFYKVSQEYHVEIKAVINTHTINRDGATKGAIESSCGYSKALQSLQPVSASLGFSFSHVLEHLFHSYLVEEKLNRSHLPLTPEPDSRGLR